MIEADILKAVRDIVRESWQTQARISDKDARFIGFAKQGIWNQSVHDIGAYGYTPAAAKRSASTHEIAIMWEVMEWMVWLKSVYGQSAVNTLRALGLGVPMQTLADRVGCDRSTIWRAEQDYLRAIIRQFYCPVSDVTADEQKQAEAFDTKASVRYMRPAERRWEGGPVAPAKVWIGGVGWFFRGKKWDDGQQKAMRKLERA